MSKVSDLSLVIYLSVVNCQDLPKVMVKWNGYCKEEDYNEKIQIELYQDALIDITRKYHIPNLLYPYFESKRIASYGDFSENKKEINALKSPFHYILKKTWDEEDYERLVKLKKEYIDVLENDK